MKLGFVVECVREGADERVLTHLAREVHGIEVLLRFECMGNKRELFEKVGGKVAGLWDDDHCDQVFVVWDLKPVYEALPDGTGLDCERERLYLLGKLRAQDKGRTTLVCITEALEAWLVVDGAAVMKAIKGSKSHDPERIPDVRAPERQSDPKARLFTAYKNFHHYRPADDRFVVEIVRFASRNKMKRSQSFARFWSRLGGT